MVYRESDIYGIEKERQIVDTVFERLYTFDDFNFDETTQRWVLKEGVPDVTEELESAIIGVTANPHCRQLQEREPNEPNNSKRRSPCAGWRTGIAAGDPPPTLCQW